MRKWILVILMCYLGQISTDVNAMTPVEAFQSLGVQYIPFDVTDKVIPEMERPFLGEFFDLIEQAVLQRVETMRALESSRDPETFVNEFQVVEGKLRQLNVPKRLNKAHRLVLEGIAEQRKFIEVWRKEVKKGRSVNIRGHRLVNSSSAKLQQAYLTLMEIYPVQGKNQQAVYNHLCALDFV